MSFQDIENESKPSSHSSTRGRIQSSSQSVAGRIFQINTGVSRLRGLVDAIGTPKDTPDHRHKLHDARQRTVQLVKETSALLKSISEFDNGGTTANDDPSKRIEHAKLAKDFQTTLAEFQKVQQLASERESTNSPFVPQPSSDTNTATISAEASMEQEEEPFLMQEKGFWFFFLALVMQCHEALKKEIMLLDNEIAFNDGIMDEREQGIIDIQDQIGQANEIFTDLSVLVHEGGVVIDDIQANVEASSGATTQGREQLSKASKRSKCKCTRCWWVLGIIAVVVIGVVILILL